MSGSATRPSIGQALISLCVVGGVAVIALTAILSAAGALSQKSRARAEYRENVRQFEARLSASRAESARKLASFGAGLGDLEALAGAARIHALLDDSCRSALGGARSQDENIESSCAIEEAPFDNAAAYHLARLTINDDVAAVARRLPASVRSPMHIRALTIETSAQRPTITMILELPGARSGVSK